MTFKRLDANPPAQSPPATLDSACAQAFIELIAERTGIVLQAHQEQGLAEVVNDACAHFGLVGADAYLTVCKSVTTESAEFGFLVTGVTVGESYFFRDVEQMRFLRERLLPRLIRRRGESGELRLRIWSAGCAMGQEIYSLAIMLTELLPNHGDWTLQLQATDIDTQVLENAMRGEYSEWSIRSMQPAMVDRYFTKSGRTYTLAKPIRDLVDFGYLNLLADEYPSIINGTNSIDLLLCRNVLIYFGQEALQSVYSRFSKCLAPGGILLTGASDPLPDAQCGLTWQADEDIGYLTHMGAPAVTPMSNAAQPMSSTAASHIIASRVSTPSKRRKQPASPPISAVDDYRHIERLIEERKWQEVISKTEQLILTAGPERDLFRMQARAHANLGNLTQARERCETCIHMDSTDAAAYFLLALIEQESGQPKEAESALRKALFLDRMFLEAHYALGMLQIHQARTIEGAKSLHNALRLAERCRPDAELVHMPGTNCGRVVELLRQELSIYEDKQTGIKAVVQTKRNERHTGQE